eukprot:gene4185-4598_t
MSEFPPALTNNLSILTEDERKLAIALVEEGQQGHLFMAWDSPGVNDDKKHEMMNDLHAMEKSMVGGMIGYLKRARQLLENTNLNPFEGWTPSLPHGVSLANPYTEDYHQYEEAGIAQLSSCGFVLVAGGLGERLGYHGIKVELPVQTLTQVKYLEFYCQQILAIQKRYAPPGKILPLAIMVSDDTHDKTVALLEKYHDFGMAPGQITLMKQGEVPALISNHAEIATSGPYKAEGKPHGHGDVHALMHSTGTARRWYQEGIKYTIFFQDTNGLAFFTLPALLGVSEVLVLEVNSMAIPRVAKQAIGAIVRLCHEDGRAMTINVEYNQLDPLLRSTISPEGDVNDPVSGMSPFPGNINQLVFRLEPYLAVLEKTHGLMPEFVNPKYKDATRTTFKKPTRLECMMQDYPKLLPNESKVGFTNAPDWLCFSACKNNSADAAVAAASGIPAASPYTAECAQYHVYAELLRGLGAEVEEGEEVEILGVKAKPSPRIVIHPLTAAFPHELHSLFPHPENVEISSRSSLVVEGRVVIEQLFLDGSLEIHGSSGGEEPLIVNISKQEAVVNAGHILQVLTGKELDEAMEVDKMRGYRLFCQEKKVIRAHDVSTEGGGDDLPHK